MAYAATGLRYELANCAVETADEAQWDERFAVAKQAYIAHWHARDA